MTQCRLPSALSLVPALAGLLVACGTPPPEGTEARIGVRTEALTLGNVLWEQKTPGTLPPARMGHALVYDAARGVTVAGGGRPVNDNGASLSDTWEWDGQSWSSASAGLPARGFIQAAFDSARGVSLFVGGLDKSGPSYSYFAQTYERSAGNWSPHSGTPGARSTAMLAYDAARAVSVLFGGYDGTHQLGDIWEWNGGSWNERCGSGSCASAPHPSARSNAVFVYDAAHAETLLFGGYSGSQILGDTWTWNGSSWTSRTGTAPSARQGCAADYDPATQRVYLFGGATTNGASGSELNELWAWDGSSWAELDHPPAPAPRRDARLAWDSARRRGVVFGGRNNDQAVDFWEFSLVGNGCASDDDCHNGVCVDQICGAPPTPPSDAGVAGSTGAGGAGTNGTPDAGGADPNAPNAADAAGTVTADPDPGVTGSSLQGANGGAAGTSNGVQRDVPKAESLYACTSAPGEGRRAPLPFGVVFALGALKRRSMRDRSLTRI